MTADEVIDFFAPEQSTTEAVMQWIVESGISADRIALSANKQVIPSRILRRAFGRDDGLADASPNSKQRPARTNAGCSRRSIR